ncbi:phosphoenolpyruvate synthase [Sulfurovum sp.]|uniref:phosphoenolpyruvate synthase n=1 Tax=Sulfurovum sp. TaxID=1969726 RepID=UPI002867EA9C|nr:phosphoenolpyruvate synthase [Sulfurovum sp.]
MSDYIKWFSEININDVDQVGGKNASLGEMYQNLQNEDIRIPNGFAITAEAYINLLDENDAWNQLDVLLDDLDHDDVKKLQVRGKKCRDIIYECTLPDDLVRQVTEGYEALKEEYGDDVTFAVRSSATAEDSPEASFAGQNESFLNVKGLDSIFDTYKRCLASNFTDRSLHYKYINGFDYRKVYLSVVVMKMVRSDIGQSGVMFSIDPETGFKDVVFINAAYGLGENIVQGSIVPDGFYIHKPTYNKGYRSVLKRSIGSKALTMIFDDEDIKNIETLKEQQDKFSLTDVDVLELAGYAIDIEKHYSKQAGYDKPMDIEWAKDGLDGKIYIVQARPETVESRKKSQTIEMYTLNNRTDILVEGSAVGTKIGSGKVRKIMDVSTLYEFKEGDVLVAHTTSPDWEPIMKLASAIVTDTGGRTCHAAIVSRELGIPAIVGASNAVEVLKDGDEVTVSCAEGERGFVYEGVLDFNVKEIVLEKLAKTKTDIMMNLANPDRAFSLASLPVDGIGLARMEFIINTAIKVHPMALISPKKLDNEAQEKINKLTSNYENPQDFFIKRLSEGVASIASAVYPKPCVVRMSDFKTNEYASLLGGEYYEPDEENPMIGFRGASRYTHPNYEEGFALECAAMKRVREEMGFENVILMIPFCRRVEEGERVLDAMKKNGLERGKNGLKIYVMCEIPNNVIQIDAFCELFDGISIGSNDLTQLTLGVDRDSELVAFDYDERDPGVMKMIEMAVEGAKRNHSHSGICGQGPSDYPEMAEALVRMGVDSMSLNPDSVLQTIQTISDLESKQKK